MRYRVIKSEELLGYKEDILCEVTMLYADIRYADISNIAMQLFEY